MKKVESTTNKKVTAPPLPPPPPPPVMPLKQPREVSLSRLKLMPLIVYIFTLSNIYYSFALHPLYSTFAMHNTSTIIGIEVICLQLTGYRKHWKCTTWPKECLQVSNINDFCVEFECQTPVKFLDLGYDCSNWNYLLFLSVSVKAKVFESEQIESPSLKNINEKLFSSMKNVSGRGHQTIMEFPPADNGKTVKDAEKQARYSHLPCCESCNISTACVLL